MNHPLGDPKRVVRIDLSGEGICTIEMADRENRNAFSERFVEELRECLDAAAELPTVKAVVLVGLEDVFAAGASRELLGRLARGEVPPTDIVLTKSMLDIPVPTIAAMEGHATGGGLALGFAADIILLSRESRYGASFMNMGFTPGMGITALLEHALSRAVAHELLYTGEFRRGSALAEKGGINHVLPKAQVRAKAFDIAAQIAEKPRPALELLKRTLSVVRRQAFEQSRTVEALMHTITFSQSDIVQRIENEYVE
ncbi:MAG TPA: polyketide synthase [Polyangiaceae bacterium]|nr:polyketide synthase [Polyangiaceae bacterium]